MMSSLEQILVETANWCSIRLGAENDMAKALRTEELWSGELMMAGARIGGLTDAEIHAARARIVGDLVQTRRRLLLRGARERVPREPADGRILCFDLEASFLDGVAAHETGGFFDVEDLPPWDTWLAYAPEPAWARQVLHSWVPKELVSVVEKAIRVHICDAYWWFALAPPAPS